MNIAVLGYGTVGSGVVEVLNLNRENITKRAGKELNVKYVLDLREFPGDPVEAILVHDFRVIAEDPEIRIVVETMGGVNPAYEYVKECLGCGKSVCTSNKELVAKHGAELLAIAKEKNVNFLFEASVGGGIPIIRPLNQSLTADEIMEITGILNGTTNFILSKMRDCGANFEDVLKEAQELGYAERNPEADVEGYDACRKLAILTSLAYGMQVDFEDIHTEGITKITAEDMAYAKALKASIKLLGIGRRDGDRFFAMVAPRMIGEEHPLYSVNNVFNGILVRGNVLGSVMFYGSGAGKLPTASAVVADVVDAAKHTGTNIMTLWSSKKLALSDVSEEKNVFFVRVEAACEGKAREVFGEVREVRADGITGEFAFLTGKMTEAQFEEKSKRLSVKNRIRVEFES